MFRPERNFSSWVSRQILSRSLFPLCSAKPRKVSLSLRLLPVISAWSIYEKSSRLYLPRAPMFFFQCSGGLTTKNHFLHPRRNKNFSCCFFFGGFNVSKNALLMALGERLSRKRGRCQPLGGKTQHKCNLHEFHVNKIFFGDGSLPHPDGVGT